MKEENLTNKTVLLVEDDEQIAGALMRKLEQENIPVSLVKNGEDGLKMALRIHPDLILLDIIMPRMSGTEVLKRLREDKWGKTACVVIITNLVDSRKEEEVAKYKVKDYLIKTEWSIDGLIEKIKKELALL